MDERIQLDGEVLRVGGERERVALQVQLENPHHLLLHIASRAVQRRECTHAVAGGALQHVGDTAQVVRDGDVYGEDRSVR